MENWFRGALYYPRNQKITPKGNTYETAITIHEREKQVEKKRKQAENFLKIKVIIPEKYLNKYLTKQDKDKLIEEIEYPKGWTTLKKSLVKQGYEVKDSASKGVRYSIISV